MELAAKIDDIGKPAWFGLLIVTFFIFWPLGLALLAFLIWSGRMGCGNGRGERRFKGMGEARERVREAWWHGVRRRAPSSGNDAFDEYRDDMLRRLEEEQREFKSYLHRLRMARDKAEFDQFMSDRAGTGPEGATA